MEIFRPTPPDFVDFSYRLGFLEDEAVIPDDFDSMGSEEIKSIFQPGE